MMQAYLLVALLLVFERIQNTTSRPKVGKVAGHEEIPSKVLQRCNLDEIILGFVNKLLLNQKCLD